MPLRLGKISTLPQLQKFFKVTLDSVSREQRSTAKMVNFGIPYGISALVLRKDLELFLELKHKRLLTTISSNFPQFESIFIHKLKVQRKRVMSQPFLEEGAI